MAAASLSSSAAPSRSEHRTRSTSQRPGAICASDVARGGGGGGGAVGPGRGAAPPGAGGVTSCGAGGAAACCGGEAGGCAQAPRQHASRTAAAYLLIVVPQSRGT